jgi:hypothetical protein
MVEVSMLEWLKSKLGPLGALLLSALPFVGYFVMRRRVAQLEAVAKVQEQNAARAAARQRAREAKAKEAAALQATLAAAKQEALAEVEVKTEQVLVAAKKKGTAAATSDYVKRIRKGGTMLLLLAFLGYSTEARAEACKEGYTVKAGESLDCDAECLPEDELLFLVKRSLACEKLEIEHATVLKQHAIDLQKAGDELALCEAGLEDTQEDLAKLTGKVVEPETPPSTYIMIGFGILITGLTIGSYATYELLR